MMIHKLAFIAALAAPTIALAAPDKGAAKLSDSDIAIIAHVHAVDQAEIDMGKLAQKTSSNAIVKAYALHIVNDHTSWDKDLTALAKKRSLAPIPLDSAPDDQAGSKANMDMMAHLKTLKGDAFDREYLAAMIDGHDKEAAKTTAAMKTATDPDLVKMLTKLQPLIQKHADDATKTQTTLKPAK